MCEFTSLYIIGEILPTENYCQPASLRKKNIFSRIYTYRF